LLFLEEKQLVIVASVYSYWRTALVAAPINAISTKVVMVAWMQPGFAAVRVVGTVSIVSNLQQSAHLII
jgi:hypothetical protein